LRSFTKAAQSLGVTQPAVSSHIKRLQELLGDELFDRSSQGVSLTPQWVASSKLTFTASISHDDDNYIGSNPVGVIPVATLTQARHDKLTGESASMIYTPIRAIMLTVSASHTTRDSNISQFHYNDVQGTVGITYKFFRYGSEL